jgi:signal transduction histidine kinase
VIIVAVEFVVSFAIGSYYYTSVRDTLILRADAANSAFMQYAQDPTQEFSALVRSYVAGFTLRDRMELMTIDGEGAIAMTSSGFMPEGADTEMPDYLQALAENAPRDYVGVLNGQRVMAVSVPAVVQGQGSLSAVRLVVELSGVDRQIQLLVFAMILVGVAVLALVLFSSSYFIGTIVNPVGQVGETARKIAQGDFTARLPKKTDDEIGELCEIINYMASELATAEQLKNDFISSVSHELRTPLTAIQGWAETVLTTGGEDRELLEKGMGVVISETGRLSQMVEELLDFSRMQSGRLRLVMARIDALAELYEACLMYAERARREGIGLIYEDDAAAVVYGDRGKLRQVFVNILDNAIKYSNPGGEVRIETAVTPQALTVRVSDKGIGIRAEDLPKVKQKFYKADSTRRGSGIGLAVADEIITRHGGTFEIESAYGEGTTVTLTLPIYTKTDETFSLTD